MNAPLTRDERTLLAAVRKHLRADGWTFIPGRARHPSGIAACWQYDWHVDGKTGRSLQVRILNRHGYTTRVPLEVDVDSVREAVDVAVAAGLLPQGMSSAYQAGLESAPQYTDQLTLPARDIERACMNDSAPGWQILDAGDETTWHDIVGVVTCEDHECVIDDIPGIECVLVLSNAWAAGLAHLESDELVQVRIPAAIR